MTGSHVVCAMGQHDVANLKEVCCQVHEVPDAEPPLGTVLKHGADFDVEEWSHAQQC